MIISASIFQRGSIQSFSNQGPKREQIKSAYILCCADALIGVEAMSVHWFWIVGWFVTLFGLVGKSWVIFIIAKTRRLHTTANWFTLSLAIADLSVTLGYFPASLVCNMLVQSRNYSIRQSRFRKLLHGSLPWFQNAILPSFIS